MKDFFGHKLEAGDFVVYPGGGNAKAEYGLLLYKILSVQAGSVRAERLDATYTQFGKPESIRRIASTLKTGTKLAYVHPPSNMIEVFNNPDSHFKLVSAWVHGVSSIDWETLEISRK